MQMNAGYNHRIISIILVVSILAIFSTTSITGAAATKAATPPQKTSMIRAGTPTLLSYNELQDLQGVPPSSIRLAVWTGSQWLEIPYMIQSQGSGTPVSSPQNSTDAPQNLLTNQQGAIDTKIIFLLPEPIGSKVPQTKNWWATATELCLNKRIAVTMLDRISNQITTVYVYYANSANILPPVYDKLRTAGTSPTDPTISNTTVNPSSSNSLGAGTDSPAQPNGVGDSTTGIGQTNSINAWQVSASETSPTIKVPRATDPTLYCMDDISGRNSKFQNTGWNQQYYYLYVPAVVTSTTANIVISGTDHGDPYARYLQVYVNSQQVLNQIVQNPSFSFLFDVKSYLNLGAVNTISIILTTWVGYWSVSSYFQYQYSASQHIAQYSANFLPGYKFHNTGWTQQNFQVELPAEIASAQLTITGQSYNNIYGRILNVYIDSAQVISGGGGLNSFSYQVDVSSNVFYKRVTTVGIVLTTWDTPNDPGEFWVVSSAISVATRYSNTYDTNAAYWHGNVHPIMQSSGVIYDTSILPGGPRQGLPITWNNTQLGTFSTEVKGQEHSQGAGEIFTPWFWVGTTVHLDHEINYNPVYMSTNSWTAWAIDIEVHENMQSITGSGYSIDSVWGAPNDAGHDQYGAAGDMLAAISILAYDYPEVAIPFGLAALLANYASTQQSSVFTWGIESTGVYLKDYPQLLLPGGYDKNDLIVYSVVPPSANTVYLITITTTIRIHCEYSYNLLGPWIIDFGTVNLVNTFQYYYGQ